MIVKLISTLVHEVVTELWRKRERRGREEGTGETFLLNCLNRERAEWDCFVLLAIWQLALLQRLLTGALTFANYISHILYLP